MGIWDFRKFGISIKSWKLVSTNSPPTLDMRIWDFSKFGLSIKSWKLVSTDPSPPSETWEFGILANLDSASKIGNWFPLTSLPPWSWEFEQIWTRHQKLEIGFHQPLPPPPWTWEFGILANLDSASKVGNWFPLTPLPPWTWEFGILANLDSASKVGNWFPPPPPQMGIWDFSGPFRRYDPSETNLWPSAVNFLVLYIEGFIIFIIQRPK